MQRMAWCFLMGGLLFGGLRIGLSQEGAPGAAPSASADSTVEPYRRRQSGPAAGAKEKPNFAELFRRSSDRAASRSEGAGAVESEDESAPAMPASACPPPPRR